jgi:hypothetical protein
MTAIVVIVLVFFCLMFIQHRAPVELSDHYYHIALINGIKRNKHRFLREHPNFIAEQNFAYPQLFHWLCSFFPTSLYTRRYTVINVAINAAILASFLCFTSWFFPIATGEVMSETAFLIAGLLFVCTPFSYTPWNAKNAGLSARSFGVLTGMWYVFSLIYYATFPEMPGAGVMVVLAMILVLLSSQFVGQYLLFSLIPLAILFKHYELILFFLSAVAVCFMMLPVVFKKYLVGQVWHKRIFGTYLVESYVLSARPSIWLDFFDGIFNKVKQQGKAAVYYVLYQPVLYLFIGIPAHVVLIYFLIGGSDINAGHNALWPLCAIVGTGFFLFFLTSFRSTRFLGEPERYVEIGIPVVTLLICCLAIQNNSMETLWYLFGFSVLMLTVQFILLWRANRAKHESPKKKALREVVEQLSVYAENKGSLLSNSWHVMRAFYATDIRTLTPIITSPYTGKFHITDLFKTSFITITEDVLFELMDAFDLDYLVLDAHYCSAPFRKMAEEKYTLVAQKDDFYILSAKARGNDRK